VNFRCVGVPNWQFFADREEIGGLCHGVVLPDSSTCATAAIGTFRPRVFSSLFQSGQCGVTCCRRFTVLTHQLVWLLISITPLAIEIPRFIDGVIK